MEILACPDPTCPAYAEVVDRWSVPSTDGPVEHVRTRCLDRHIFTVPIDGVRWTSAPARRWTEILPTQNCGPDRSGDDGSRSADGDRSTGLGGWRRLR